MPRTNGTFPRPFAPTTSFTQQPTQQRHVPDYKYRPLRRETLEKLYAQGTACTCHNTIRTLLCTTAVATAVSYHMIWYLECYTAAVLLCNTSLCKSVFSSHTDVSRYCTSSLTDLGISGAAPPSLQESGFYTRMYVVLLCV